jgi:hypothetical protein
MRAKCGYTLIYKMVASPLRWYNVAISNVDKVIIMPRVFTNIVPGEGGWIFGGYFRDIVQHSLYLIFCPTDFVHDCSLFLAVSANCANYHRKLMFIVHLC